MFINLKLKLYRIFFITSLACSLFVFAFFNLWWSCNYTGVDEVASKRAQQLAARGWDAFILDVLFLKFCVYIKIPKKRDIFWDTIWGSSICLYVN